MKNKKNIISVSRRTDIPAFHSDWFLDKLDQGFVNVKNPFNPNQVRKVSLIKEDVLCFVFWTKNPRKMIDDLAKKEFVNIIGNSQFFNDSKIMSQNCEIRLQIPI